MKAKKARADLCCPVCGSCLIQFTEGLTEKDDGSVLFPAECHCCGAAWSLRYEFSGIENIEILEEGKG